MKKEQAKDRLLCSLRRHCLQRLPVTGRLYGGENLKALLDARKWNWIPGRRRGVKVQRPGGYYQKLPWFREWIRRARGDGKTMYSAKAHNAHHASFKDCVSKTFAKRASKRNGVIFALDDFDEGGVRLRTLGDLAKAGTKRKRVHIANPNSKLCQAARRQGAQAVQSSLQDALASEWKGLKSGAAYLDTCSGSWEYVADLLEGVLAKSNRRYLLAFTLLSRAQKRKTQAQDEASPACLVSRLAALDRTLVAKGFSKIGNDDSEAVFSYAGKVVTVFYER